MRTENILISLMALIVGSLLILSGLVTSLSTFFELAVIENFCILIQSHAWECSFSLLIVGSLLLGLCSYACRFNYLHVEMGDYSLHSKVIKDLAQKQLKSLFSDQPCQCEVVVHHAKEIEIFADLPFLEPARQPQKLREIEKTLSQLLKTQAHFNHPFLLHAHFRDS